MKKILKIPMIAISGGPAGGKSSFLNRRLRRLLKRKGFIPFIISEAASLIASFGVNLGDISAQKAILRTILAHEDAVIDYIKEKGIKNAVIITDRSALDALAYCTEEEFKKVCKELGTTIDELRRRYSAVIHLRSLAVDKPKIYEKVKKNNPHRKEDANQASELDGKTILANLGIKQIWSVGNKTNAKKKLEIAFNLVMHVLGYPVPYEIERGWLVDINFTPEQIPVKTFKIEITQNYLKSRKRNQRVRKEKFPDKKIVYTHTLKNKVSKSVREEDERHLWVSDYVQLLRRRHPEKAEITKHRYKFLYLEQYFELDFFYDKKLGKYLVKLEIELTRKYQHVKLPKWLPIKKEVTGIDKYNNNQIAKKVKISVIDFYS